ncbi:hypothetical protein BH09ACT10_BH09ACT10_26840 [soil metagenome]
MMTRRIAGIFLALSVVGGIGTGVIANALATEEPASATEPKATASTSPTSAPTTNAPTKDTPVPFRLSPGSIGPVSAGMSKADALATGYFDADVPAPVEGCAASPLVWKKEYAEKFDVQTVGNGEITSIGVRDSEIRTASGLGVGSTYGEVRAAIADSVAVEAGYGQSGVFDYDADNGGWIGYLFDPAVSDLKDSDKVSFVEVTKGDQPGLMRDGC